MAIKLGGSGDVTETHRLWRTERNPQSIGTGLYIDGYVYRPNAKPTTIECIEPKTGKIIWKERAGKGETIIFKPSPDGFQSVATNPLEDVCSTTPAVSNGRIFIRAYKHLYCIAAK